jgi:hypothetical protein
VDCYFNFVVSQLVWLCSKFRLTQHTGKHASYGQRIGEIGDPSRMYFTILSMDETAETAMTERLKAESNERE